MHRFSQQLARSMTTQHDVSSKGVVAVLALAAATVALANPAPAPSSTPPAPSLTSAPAPADEKIIPDTAAGETREYRNAELAFSMRVPAAWRNISALELNAFNTLLPETQRKNPYVAGFVAAEPGDFGYPYMLIQHFPKAYAGATWADVERDFGAASLESIASEIDTPLRDLVDSISLQAPRVDRARARVLQSISGATGPETDAPRYRGLSVFNLGSERVVALHSYQLQQEFGATMPAFSAAADSFRFDHGAEFVPSSPGLGLARSAIVGGVIGVAVAGTVAILLARKKGRKNA